MITKKSMRIITLLMGLTAAASAQTISSISPDTAPQGTTDLTVTFTLSGLVPPSDAPADSASIGSMSGSSVDHASEYTVTATFDVPFTESTGTKDATVVFATPEGNLEFSMTDGFTVTEGADTAPSITTEPQSLTLSVGNQGFLDIEALGSSPLTYQWKKESINISGATNSSYSIASITESDEGDYQCVVINPYGSATSSVATITIDTNDYSSAFTYLLIETGQTECFDTNGLAITPPAPGEAFSGQDAQYTSTAMNYRNNGNDTISDLHTGLMWEKVPQTDGLSWAEAKAYCEDLILAGYDDWRMPTCKELFSISDFSEGWPYLNTDYFDLATGEVSKDEQFWAADYYVGVTVEGGSSAAFGVNHVTGHIKAYAADVSGNMGNYVRAVRGDTYGENNFQDNGNGTITDQATGLMWQQADSGEGMDWPTALAYAENLEIDGYCDWRLPNIKELQGILDYTKSPTATDTANLGPAINTNYFSVSQISTNLTNTNPDYGYYWSSTSAYFSKIEPGNYYAWYIAVGTAINDEGNDFHGAGGVRFDTMVDGGPAAEEEERVYNYVLCVRGGATSADTDTDEDGLSDWYEYNYSASTTAMDPTADDDEDGVSNEDEETAGTIPTDADSILKMTGISYTNGSLSICWRSELDRTYTLQSCTNLTTDAFSTVVATDINATYPTNTFTELESGSNAVFYRVIVE